MKQTHRTQTNHHAQYADRLHHRRGNLLVGCGVVLAVLVILVAIGGYIVATNWRSWTASTSTKMIDTMLTEAQIDPDEHAEIMLEIESVMERFENKEITVEEIGKIVEELAESPVIPAALVIALDKLYITTSGLPEEERVQARTDLTRFTQGLFDESIDPNAINGVLEPVVTNTPDDNDIRLNLTLDQGGGTITALRSADEVSDEELRTLIANAKSKADEAGVGENPEPIDLSDEIKKAIGIALGEISRETDSLPDPSDTPDLDPDQSTDPIDEPIDDQEP